jgi:hypothetical protein
MSSTRRPRRPARSLADVPYRELETALRTLSLRAVAKRYGVERTTVRYWRDKLMSRQKVMRTRKGPATGRARAWCACQERLYIPTDRRRMDAQPPGDVHRPPDPLGHQPCNLHLPIARPELPHAVVVPPATGAPLKRVLRQEASLVSSPHGAHFFP